METQQITLHLTQKEMQALLRLARGQYRHPRQQILYLVKTALLSSGLLQADNPHPDQSLNNTTHHADLP